MQKITPFLWFDTEAEEAMNFYVGIFKNSKAGPVVRNPESMPGETGTVMTVSFELDGQQFMALNGGTYFKITPAISLFVNCETQDEIDYFWEKLSTGGSIQQCGWLTDKFGVSWQIVPSILSELLHSPDAPQMNRVMAAMMKMIKFDIAALHAAADAK